MAFFFSESIDQLSVTGKMMYLLANDFGLVCLWKFGYDNIRYHGSTTLHDLNDICNLLPSGNLDKIWKVKQFT